MKLGIHHRTHDFAETLWESSLLRFFFSGEFTFLLLRSSNFKVISYHDVCLVPAKWMAAAYLSCASALRLCEPGFFPGKNNHSLLQYFFTDQALPAKMNPDAFFRSIHISKQLYNVCPILANLNKNFRLNAVLASSLLNQPWGNFLEIKLSPKLSIYLIFCGFQRYQ